jgi:hypothetical protein
MTLFPGPTFFFVELMPMTKQKQKRETQRMHHTASLDQEGRES